MARTYAEALSRVPMSRSLDQALRRAHHYAFEQAQRRVTLEHLLLALIEDADAAVVLQASNVDLARLSTDVSAHVSRIEDRFPRGQPGDPAPDDDLLRILEYAAAAAHQSRRREINGAIVVAAIVGDGKTIAAAILQSQGLTFDEAIRAIQRSAQQRTQPAARPQPVTPQANPAPTSAPPPAPTPAPTVPTLGRPGPTPALSADDILAQVRERIQTGRPSLPTTGPPQAPYRDAPPYDPAAVPKTAAPPRPASENSVATGADGASPGHPQAAISLPPATAPEWAVAAGSPAWETASRPTEPRSESRMSDAISSDRPPPGEPVVPPAAIPQASRSGEPAGPPSDASFSGWPPATAMRTDPQAPRPTQPPPPAEPLPRTYPPAGAPPPRAATEPYGQPPMRPPLDAATSPSPFAGYPPPNGGEHARAALPPMPPQPAYIPQPHSVPRGGQGPRLGLDMSSANDSFGRGSTQPQSVPPAARAPEPLPGPAARVGLEPGQLIENIPRVMTTGVTETIEVRIARADLRQVGLGLEGQGAPVRHDLVITRAMSVRLRAPDGGFVIETASPDTQWIENRLGLISDEFASWRWQVTPTRRGSGRLQLIVSARTVGVDGLAAESTLPDQTFEVRVKTNMRSEALRWGGWAAAAVAGGVLAKLGEYALGLIG